MAKKRANGEGSIRKRKDGRWEGRYTAGHTPEGKAIYRKVLGKTQAEDVYKRQGKTMCGALCFICWDDRTIISLSHNRRASMQRDSRSGNIGKDLQLAKQFLL